MNPNDMLEHELASHLRRQAAMAPGDDGWAPILDRVAQRHRRRQRRRVAATTLCLVAMAAGVLSLGGRIGSERGPVSTGPASTAPAPTGRLPHLLLNVSGYQLDHAGEAYFGPEEQASAAGQRLSVLTRPGEGYGGPVLFVATAAPGTGYGVGDQNPAARTVDVGGRTGWLSRGTGLPVTSLGWHLADGSAVHLMALRLDDDALLAAARSVVVAADGAVSWPDGSLPARLVLQRSTPPSTGLRATAEVTYVRGDDRLTLKLQSGGQDVLDDLVRDRASAALEIGETAVAGVPAVLSLYEGDDRSSLMWQVRPGVVAELVARGTSARTSILAAANTIGEIDEASWQDLLDRFTDGPSAGATPAQSAERGEAVLGSTCALRGKWLAAGPAGRDAAVTELRSLRRHAVETGLDRDTDMVVVLDRLAAAMAAGDAATVRSIPESGACG